MAKFVKKPVEIEAVQWTGDNSLEIDAFSNSQIVEVEREGFRVLEIYTLEGVMTAQINDWIIKGVKGEFYPCKPEIFDATYEKPEVEIDPWHIKVISMKDQPDGSAIVNFEIGKEAQKVFLEMGLLKVLTDAAHRAIDETADIDTNVGC